MKRHGETLNAYYRVKEAKMKRLRTIGFQLHDILVKTKLWRHCQAWEKGGGMTRNNREDFGRSENTLYDIIICTQVTTYQFKTREGTSARVNSNVNYRLWVNIICQCRFISCNQCTTLVGHIDNGGWHVSGQRSKWKVSGLSPQFCHEPIVAPKKNQDLSKKKILWNVFSVSELLTELASRVLHSKWFFIKVCKDVSVWQLHYVC